jgi:hypothetical protein
MKKKSMPRRGKQRNRCRSKKKSKEEKLFTVLKEELTESTKETETNYESTLFMFCLVLELNKFSETMKLNIKSDLLNAFKGTKSQQHATVSVAPFLWLSLHDETPSK